MSGLTALLSALLLLGAEELKPQGGERQMARFQTVVVLHLDYVPHLR